MSVFQTIDAELGIEDTGPEPDVHSWCGLTAVRDGKVVPCKCHRYCDPRWCMEAAYASLDQED